MIEFAELQEFKDLKLKNYSSGMHVRLAFSVAIQVDADILLIDEVLAVGDAAFQQKCFDVFNDMRDEGKTIVFVTHDMGACSASATARCCSSAATSVYLGDPDEVADRYLELNFGRDARGRRRRRRARGGDGEARVLEVWVEDERRRAALDGAPARPDHPQGPGRVHGGRRRPVGQRVRPQRASTRRSSSPRRRSRTSAPATSAPARRLVFSFALRQRAGARAATSPMFKFAHRGSGLDLIDRFEGEFSFVVTGAAAPGRPGRPAGAGRHRRGSPSVAAREAHRVTVERARRRTRPPSVAGFPTRRWGGRSSGPRALTDDWRRFWHLTYNIAVTEWKLRFFGSALGYVWQLMRPLLLFGVLYIFFTSRARSASATGPGGELLRRPAAGLDRAVHLLRRGDDGAVRSVVDSETLVRKIQFPRLVIPLSVVLLALFNLSLNLVVVLIFALIAGRAADAHAGSSCR